ncbi:hypothetical protein KW783_02150 [Candidatus Parcubacteria bacterium]|nr:hypothetical protein [Candidatus Parcubacteria bacterium]
MKKIFILIAVVIILFVGAVVWSRSLESHSDNPILATTGIHWHPRLTIIVRGEVQTLRAGIGIGSQYASNRLFDGTMGMTSMHTHDDASEGIIHLEFSEIVRRNDVMLGQFLTIWGKDINSFGSNVKMTVNGVSNTELGNYSMKDGDKIELRYE